MTETNLNIVLSNALCCSSQLATKVGKLYDTGNLCVDTEFNKLKLLVDRINTLKCYDFPTETLTSNINSEFFTTLVEVQGDRLYRIILLNIQLTVNGITYNIVSDGVNTALALIVNKLTELGFFIFYINSKGSPELTFGLTCNILDLSFNIRYSDTPWVAYSFTNTVPGMCPQTIIIPAQNCLTEEQADIMMHDIMRQCDICDCQLTT